MSKLYFVIFKEDGIWVAQCLHHNIVTHGATLEDIRIHVEAVVQGYLNMAGVDAILALPQAEQKYWDMYLEAFKAGRDLDAVLSGESKPDSTSYLEIDRAA